MIPRKLKTCLGCGKPKLIFSHGYCIDCYRKLNYKPLKRSPIKQKVKKVIQNGEDLTQKEAFLVAYVKGGKKWFLTNKPVSIEELTASNFAHVLSKKQYKWFKYYWKNIRILPAEVHHVFDQGTADQYQEMIDNFTPQERYNWDRFIKLRYELKQEYAEWIKTNIKEYKL